MVSKTGGCKYCGQIVTFETEDKPYTLADLDTMASERCSCTEAMRQRRVGNAIRKAQEDIDEMFALEEDERTTMKACASLVGMGRFQNVSLKIDERTKVTIKLTSKGNIKIDKSVTSVETRES